MACKKVYKQFEKQKIHIRSVLKKQLKPHNHHLEKIESDYKKNARSFLREYGLVGKGKFVFKNKTLFLCIIKLRNDRDKKILDLELTWDLRKKNYLII